MEPNSAGVRRVGRLTRRRETWNLAATALLTLALPGCDRGVLAQQRIAGADPANGRAVMAEIACGVCHVVPGIRGANGIVGPSLAGFGRRQLIGGVAPNQPAVLVTWVKDAPSIAPNTGMPNLPLTEAQARDVAAYLYTLR